MESTRLDIEDMLARTSRTFALAIPLLEEPTRRAVSLAYLLLRIADTFEDATRWPRARRVEALVELSALLSVVQPGPGASPSIAHDATDAARRWLATPPVDHADYLALVARTPEVLAELDALAPSARAIVARHATRTIDGMAMIVARADAGGALRLASLGDLRDYCYLVAGIVGELLTELFVHDAPSLSREQPELERHMAAFGEGLQLVNVLKDARDDARDGRVYLPSTATRAEVLALARRDLDDGAAYLRALERGGAPRGTVGFCALLLTLAGAALDRLEAKGAGAKIARDEVMRLFAMIEDQYPRESAAARFPAAS